MTSLGTHCLIELYGCPEALLDDVEAVQAAIRLAAEAGRCTLLHETAHRFVPQGVTALALLGESHISVHTWPESGYAAADVFTCGERALPQAACESLARSLQASRHELRTLERGADAPQPAPARVPADGPVATGTARKAAGEP